MTEDVLAEAMVPFVFDMADDLATKELLKDQPTTLDLLHSGVRYGAVRDLAQKNIDHIQNQLAACAALVTEPMVYGQFYAAWSPPWTCRWATPSGPSTWSGTSAPIWSTSSTGGT